jgi:hypothetical protein
VNARVAAALLLLFATGCSTSKPPAAPSLLSDQTVESRDGSLTGRIPRGWFPAAEESLATGAILWLMREDLAAGVAVTELHLDAAATALVRDRGISALGAASRSLRGLRPDKEGLEEIEIGGNRYCAYSVNDAGGARRGRVVVFERGKKFYECELVLLRPAAGTLLESVERLQEAFVEALKAPATSS